MSALTYQDWRVELRRHVGHQKTDNLGIVAIEHPQKLVLVYPPDLAGQARQCGILGDHEGATFQWLPKVQEDAPPALQQHVEQEAARLKLAGEFVDPPA